MAASLADLIDILEPHAEREERGLFVALAADEDLRACVPSLLAEHGRFHGPVDRSPAGVVAFLDDLAAHIDREEHDVFPAASQLLPAAAWAGLVAV